MKKMIIIKIAKFKIKRGNKILKVSKENIFKKISENVFFVPSMQFNELAQTHWHGDFRTPNMSKYGKNLRNIARMRGEIEKNVESVRSFDETKSSLDPKLANCSDVFWAWLEFILCQRKKLIKASCAVQN